MAAPTQSHRPIAISTPLGADALLLRRFSCAEGLNRCFRIEAVLLSTDHTMPIDEMVGQTVCVRMSCAEGQSERFFHGHVSRFAFHGREAGFAQYRAVIVPWLTLLSHETDCRIFQNQTTPQIIEEVFKRAGFDDYELRLTEPYPVHEYCVQYAETSAAFVSRLLEREGISYHFRHEQNRHVLVLADAISRHVPFPGYPETPFEDAAKSGTVREAVHKWEALSTAQSAGYAHGDFDFKAPRKKLECDAPAGGRLGPSPFGRFEYPGAFITSEDGSRLAKVRMDEIQVPQATVIASGSSRGVAAGSLLKLVNHPRGEQNQEYLVTHASLRFTSGAFSSTGQGDGVGQEDDIFECTFEAMPSRQTYRPPRVTPRPRMMGPQTAVVTGPAGEEIYTDEHGRVKVHFHWDRHGRQDATSSCWVRVSQAWAGKGFGAQYLPRVGQEVIVDFLDGDPDRPIITGRVYNGEARPPYSLPAEKNVSGLRSQTTKGGGGFNEVRFDDTRGKEQLSIQAERDRFVLVKHDNVEQIKHDESITIGRDQTIDVKDNIKSAAGKRIVITAGEEIVLQSGSASICLKQSGQIEIVGVDVTLTSAGGKVHINAAGIITINGPLVKIN